MVSCNFNFLFRILFNFLSLYFFAIGLADIFRLSRNVPRLVKLGFTNIQCRLPTTPTLKPKKM